MTVTRLAGWVAGGSTGPWVALSVGVGWFCAGQGACGRALRRVQALVITVAQGQVREIFRWRRRPLWGQPGGGVQDFAAQGFGFRADPAG
jgi:hypothetical protein